MSSIERPRTKKQIESAENLAKMLRQLADKVERGIVVKLDIRMSVDYDEVTFDKITRHLNGHEDFNMELSLYDPERDHRDQISKK